MADISFGEMREEKRWWEIGANSEQSEQQLWPWAKKFNNLQLKELLLAKKS